jgi:hypothetical protein
MTDFNRLPPIVRHIQRKICPNCDGKPNWVQELDEDSLKEVRRCLNCGWFEIV